MRRFSKLGFFGCVLLQSQWRDRGTVGSYSSTSSTSSLASSGGVGSSSSKFSSSLGLKSMDTPRSPSRVMIKAYLNTNRMNLLMHSAETHG